MDNSFFNHTRIKRSLSIHRVSHHINSSYKRHLKPLNNKKNKKNKKSNTTTTTTSDDNYYKKREREQMESKWKALGVTDLKQMDSQTFQIIFLGNSLVGKKTLRKKLSDSTCYQHHRIRRPSSNSSNTNKSDNNNNNKYYRFMKWGEEERFIQMNFPNCLESDNSFTVSILNDYLNVSDAIVLCFRLDDKSSFQILDDFEDAIIWDKITDESLAHVPIFLVGTHAEIPVHQREVSFKEARDLCERLPNCLGYFETSIVEQVIQTYTPRTSRTSRTRSTRRTTNSHSDSDSDSDTDTDTETENSIYVEDDSESSSSGVEFLMYQIARELYMRKWGRKQQIQQQQSKNVLNTIINNNNKKNNNNNNKKPFSMKYVDFISAYEYTPYIPQLDEFIDVYSTAANINEISSSSSSSSVVSPQNGGEGDDDDDLEEVMLHTTTTTTTTTMTGTTTTVTIDENNNNNNMITNSVLLTRSETLEQLEAIDLGPSKLHKFTLWGLFSLFNCCGANFQVLQ